MKYIIKYDSSKNLYEQTKNLSRNKNNYWVYENKEHGYFFFKHEFLGRNIKFEIYKKPITGMFKILAIIDINQQQNIDHYHSVYNQELYYKIVNNVVHFVLHIDNKIFRGKIESDGYIKGTIFNKEKKPEKIDIINIIKNNDELIKKVS